MLLTTLLKQYVEFQQSIGTLRESSRNNYRYAIQRYIRFLAPDEQATVADMTALSMRRYAAFAGSQSKEMVRPAKNGLSHFCRWLIQERWIQTNLAADIPLPRLKKVRREALDDDVVEKLLEACDRIPSPGMRPLLAKALLSALIYGGLRLGEALALTEQDINFKRGTLRLLDTKGGENRTIAVCREFMDALQEYRKLLPPHARPTRFFIWSALHPLSEHGVYRIINRVKIIAGYPDLKITPHMFRHTCATRLARNGAPLHAIQAFLGHKALVTTAIYIHNNEELLFGIAHLTSLNKPAAPESPKPKASEPAPERRRVEVRRTSR